MTTLVIAAHPDDEVLGCGGTITKLAQQGESVFIAILGEGITSRYQQRTQANQEIVNLLHTSSYEVAKTLGAQELFMYNLPDNRFDTIPLLDVVKIIEELIGRITPQVIYTQHGGDLNIDHVVTYRATLTATRPTIGQPVREIYSYEVASSTEWAFNRFAPVFHPNTFVDITNTLETKIQAMEQYESESRAFPHPRSPEALKAIAYRWGSVIGCKAAEAFELVRAIR